MFESKDKKENQSFGESGISLLYSSSGVLPFFAEGYGRVPEIEMGYRYNLIPFTEVRRFWVYRELLGTFAVVTNIFGNVIGFIPFGFIMPVISPKMNSLWFVTLCGFVLSLVVECIQLVTKVGCFDVDDLILNTLGAFLGYIIFEICNRIRRKIHGKKI